MVLFYDDSPVFGGHEIMALHAVEGLLEEGNCGSVVFFANPENTLLFEGLEKISNRQDDPNKLRVEHSPQPIGKPAAVTRGLRTKDVNRLARRFQNQDPDQVIAVQGDIASSVLGLLAARQAGIPAISYIPVPHTLKEMGAKLGAIRDLLDTPLFKIPDGFITISKSMAQKLAARSRGVKVIDVVPNGIPDQYFKPLAMDEARSRLGLSHSGSTITLVGRLEFKQKQQDFMLNAFAQSDLKKDCRLLFVGDGPDKDRLVTLIGQLGLEDRVNLLPWQKDMAAVYSASDLVVIPSRFEGFPLVMLESVRCNTPVVAANRDGMADFLPRAWRFEPGSKDSFIERISAVLDSDQEDQLAELNRQIDEEMTIAAFRRNFCRSLARFSPQRSEGVPDKSSDYHPALSATETGFG